MTIAHGDIVIDRDDPSRDPDKAVVINKPSLPATDWTIPEIGATVAQENPRYPADSRVAIVVFLEHAREHIPEYQGGRAVPLSGLSANSYSFPRPRLETVDTLDDTVEEYVTGREPTPDPPVTLRTIRDRLESGGADVSFVPGGRAEPAHLVVAKLGEVYTVFEDGTVTGDGALAGRLQEAVGEIEVKP